MSRKLMSAVAVASIVGLFAAGCGSSSDGSSGPTTSAADTSGNTASDTGVTATAIKVGYIYSKTGVAASSYIGAEGGVRARFELENAKGGVFGRKLEVVPKDDQTSPAGFTTAAHDLVQNEKVFGVMPISSLTFAGSEYLNQQGIPVAGSAFDGPEWGMLPNSNMFSFIPPFSTTFGGKHYNYAYYADFLGEIGATKIGGLGYGISPSSQESIKAILSGAGTAGVDTCYANYSVPFGAVDFTAAALSIKSKGCNLIVGALVNSSNVALAQAVKNAGIDTKLWFLQGYDQNTLDDASARATIDGAYIGTSVVFDPKVPNVATMLDALHKYGGLKEGALPNFGTWTSYAAADLFIAGLKAAGKNPTRASFISNLRKETKYDVGGLVSTPVDFTKFGTVDMFPATACTFLVQLKGDKFVPAINGNGKVCGKRTTY